MKILLLTTHLNTGGITSYLLTLSRGLIAEGHQVHVMASGGNMVPRFWAAGVKVKEMDFQTKSELSLKIYRSLRPVADYVKEHKIDVIHAQTRVTQVMAQFLKWIYKIPFVTTCHGFFKPRFFRRAFGCWGKAVIAISPPVEAHLQQDLNVPQNKIVTIESGIPLDDFVVVTEKLKAENRRAIGLKDEPIIGMIARLSDVKGQDILLRAFTRVVIRFPDAKLFLVGRGKEEDSLKELTAELRLHNKVIFCPDQDQTTFYLSIMDVFVNPSRQEGLGLSVMEAQACGLPVVASNVGGIPTLVEHGKTGYLVDPENPGLLAEQLIEVLEKKEEARKVGLNARSFIEQKYSSQRMVDQTIRLYQKALAK